MTHAVSTRSRTRRARSVADLMSKLQNLDYLMLARCGVWIAFCVLLVLA